MSDEIDFADRSKIVEDPTLATGELEAYRELLKQKIAVLRNDAPTPDGDKELELGQVDLAYELLEESVGRLIEETDLELEDSTFVAIMKPDAIEPLELNDLEYFSTVAKAHTSSLASLNMDLRDDAPMIIRARARLSKSRTLLRVWAWAFFVILSFKAERSAITNLNKMLIGSGLSGAEGSLKSAVLLKR